MSDPLTNRIAAAFRDCTLPEAEWSHEAHLRVGLWHLLRFPPAEAMHRLRDGIRTFNTSCGIANTDTSGYHETITRFYVLIIDHFLGELERCGESREQPVDELAAKLVDRCGDRRLPLRYFSRELLFSKEARRRWVEPDLEPLPGWEDD